ncbi:MAG TPA: 6-phosphofructokinase, partial [Anaerolineaceae bacterium]|nr:6-phosphofructokinase [Anaerolineaceae bacterium]
GVPKTIDNDVGWTDFTFGFDTAVNTAMEAIDRLHTTAESHHRVMVLELMGRDAGFIALHAGIAGGADVILIPEIPFERRFVCQKVTDRVRNGAFFSIVVVAEGAKEKGGEPVYVHAGDEVRQARLGGIGQAITGFIAESCAVETRLVVLGHLQRGGSPTAFDRVLASRLGSEAVRVAAAGRFGHMVALKCGVIADVSLDEALATVKRVNVEGDTVRTARGLGISLGDR